MVGISIPICFILDCIESARRTNANAMVMGIPVPDGSATDVIRPTIISSLLPNTYNVSLGCGVRVKFSTSRTGDDNDVDSPSD